MNIVSGILKGQKIKAPKGAITRPTPAKVRDAVMNTWQGQLENARFIDVCAGTGAMGLEALSRGANSIVWIEQDRNACRAIRANIEEAQRRFKEQGLDEFEARLISRSVEKVSGVWGDDNQPLFVWADPPYAIALKILERICSNIQRESVHLGFECGVGDQEKAQAIVEGIGLQPVKFKSYGETWIGIWEGRNDS